MSQNSKENLTEVPFVIKSQPFNKKVYLKSDSSTGVFCEFCEIFKSSYFVEHLRTTASALPEEML